ncbi:MAG: hypothetical protein IJO52_08070, partial [Clostridia bacterium]|nr:hypothetical protein [Clostridia bacterium]
TSGEFLLENDGNTITVLQRKDRTTNEIISEKTIDFTEEYTDLEFVAWYNERYAVIRLNQVASTSYAIVDGLGGAYAIAATTNDMPAFLTESLEESEDNPADGMLECYNTLISHKYLQCYDNVQDIMKNTYEQYPSGGYVDIFSGIRYESGLNREDFTGQNKLISVSDDASYALFKTSLASDPNRNIEYVIFNSSSGKYYTLTDILGNEAFIDDAFFVYNNVLFVNYAEINTGKEASCSIKLSF